MLPATPMSSSVGLQIFFLHLLNGTNFTDIQNSIAGCDQLQQNVITVLEQKLLQSTAENENLQQALQDMTGRNVDLARKNLELMEELAKLEKEKYSYQLQSTHSRSQMLTISHQADAIKATFEALGKQINFIVDEIGESTNESDKGTSKTNDHWILGMKKQSENQQKDLAFKIGDDHNMILSEQRLKDSYNVRDFNKLLLPLPNDNIKNYETELGSAFGSGSVLIMKTVIENGTSITFEQVGGPLEKLFKLTFNLENETVHNYFEHVPIYISGKTLYKLEKDKQSIITIHFMEDGLEMRVDENSYVKFFYPYNGVSFNYIKISDAKLSDIQLYQNEITKETYTKRKLDCSGGVCDLVNIPKIGTVFSFTGRMPYDDSWVQCNFMENREEIPIHMSIRWNVGSGYTVFNHKENNYWEDSMEEHEHWFPFKHGHTYNMIFNIQTTGTTISVDGLFFHYFKHRTDVETVTQFQYNWEILEAFTYTKIGKPASELVSHIDTSETNEHRIPGMKEQSAHLQRDQAFEIRDDHNMTLSEQRLEDSYDVKDINELLLPHPNDKIKNYETEVGSAFGSGSELILKTIIENGTSITFKQVGGTLEKLFKLTFNLENETVDNYFESGPIHISGETLYKLENDKESIITIHFMEDGLEMRVDENRYEKFIYPYNGILFNYIKISDAKLSDIQLNQNEIIEETYAKRKLNCLGDVCDLVNIPKIGSVFSFTGRMPYGDPQVQCNFKVNDEEIPVHLSIRENVGSGETVFNHLEEYDYWDVSMEEREYWFPFKQGLTYNMTFNIQKAGTTISVDGLFFHYFKHRTDIEPVAQFQTDLEILEAFIYTKING